MWTASRKTFQSEWLVSATGCQPPVRKRQNGAFVSGRRPGDPVKMWLTPPIDMIAGHPRPRGIIRIKPAWCIWGSDHAGALHIAVRMTGLPSTVSAWCRLSFGIGGHDRFGRDVPPVLPSLQPPQIPFR